MKLTEEQLLENWNKLLTFIKETFPGERGAKLLKLYESLDDRFILMPASGTDYFHSAYPGGYVVHILNVIENTKMLYKLWERQGADMSGYTKEELLFVALNHDLGKVGDEHNEYYLPNKSEWHIKNRGEIYTQNPDIVFMKVPDRSIYMLQLNGITMSQNEYLGIKLHDGIYDEANKSYLMSYNPNNVIKTNLTHIVHQADFMAYRIEYEQWKNSKTKPSEPTFTQHTKNHEKFKPKAGFTEDKTEQIDNLKSAFQDLFKS